MPGRSGTYADARAAAGVQLAVGVLETVRQHVSMHPDREVGGVLVGYTAGARITVNAVIPGFRASAPGPVTVLADAWSAVVRELDRYRGQQIVGWYHSHRDTGALLSAQDLDIHRRYFNSPEQIALVVEPDGRESWFCWKNGKLVQLGSFGGFSAGRAKTTSHQPTGTGAIWAQRAACAVIGCVLGSVGWLTIIRGQGTTIRTARAPVVTSVTSSEPVAHPIVEEPQAGVQSGSTTSGR